jgi:ATP-dependent DNA helicase RecQ
VVLPTGGGKSLCYQAPAAHLGRLAVVVSPLIALMKDQVDGLREAGVAAAFLNSSQTAQERAAVFAGLAARRYHLLYVAPERLVMEGFAERLARANPTFFAVDEAHCISQWGHDFRPEYRQLRMLRATFPDLAVHAYTATATLQVRGDIIAELGLENPVVLVGSFDRPNLVYRVRPRGDRLADVLAAIARHRDRAGIIYCIRRAEVDELAAALTRRGLKAVPYHAGLADDVRRAHQDAFVNERADIVVATVAFGMGIDRSNVRYVVHAGMPKSLEHYQQESGRAGRDGLEAECLLLHSGSDYGLWKSVLGDPPPPGALRKLGEMYAFCQDALCRHKALVTYFGQPYDAANCGACDVCLAETVQGTDTAAVSGKILSGAAELRGRFGATHVADVLCGAATGRIGHLGHDRLTAYGSLRGEKKSQVRAWIDQLMAQGLLARSDDEYPTLLVTQAGHAVLRGEAAAAPLTTAMAVAAPAPARRASGVSPEPALGERPVDASGVPDSEIFEILRALRKSVAEERGVPPYLIFSDASLRDMARLRPGTLDEFRAVKGVGDWKLETFGDRFVRALRRAVGAG